VIPPSSAKKKTSDGVAIMTDTDNAQGKASAYFGDIYFTEN